MDVNHGGAALLIGLLLGHGRPMVCLTGRAVHQASAAYRGQGTPDAGDAFVIADHARVGKDLGVLRPGDETAVDLSSLRAASAIASSGRTWKTPPSRHRMKRLHTVCRAPNRSGISRH